MPLVSSMAKRVVVSKFGGVEELMVVEEPDPAPGPGQVRVRLTSVGLNHADLMGRRGEYRLMSGDPPFTPGLEGGGTIDATGDGVAAEMIGRRVCLDVTAPRRGAAATDPKAGMTGTYRTAIVVDQGHAVSIPDEVPDAMAGALWLTYLTAWGGLIWRQGLRPGQWVAIPAASSGVGLAAAQVAKAAGAVVVGLTTKAAKIDALKDFPESAFDHYVATGGVDGRSRSWHRDLLRLTEGRGIDVFFDPVASGAYLESEIKSLAPGGTIWVYGLLGRPGPVDVTPLIRKRGAIRGWLLNELPEAGPAALATGYTAVLDGFRTGAYRQRLAGEFPLSAVAEAHEAMERGEHMGKLVLRPDRD